jgi:hypothetical protein
MKTNSCLYITACLSKSDRLLGNVDASGEGGGRIFIRGGELVADNGWIFADTRGSEEGQGIDIGVTGQVTMRNGALITTDTLGSGGGGDLTVEAGSLEMRNGAGIGSTELGSSSGESGNVTITANRVFLSGEDGGFAPFISARNTTVTAGNLEMRNEGLVGANIMATDNMTVTANRVFLSGFGVGILANGDGDFGPPQEAGNITVTARNLEVHNGAQVK